MVTKNKNNLKHIPILSHSDPSLLILIIDITPSEWQHRDTIRLVKDKINLRKKKPSSGPASFHEYISSILAFCLSFGSLNRDNTLCVIGVAGENVALVYPRVGKAHGYMESVVHDPTEFVGSKMDARKLYDGVHLGIAELIVKQSERMSSNINPNNPDNNDKKDSPSTSFNYHKGAAMSAAFSMALCLINRFMVAAHAQSGVSALASSTGTPLDEQGSIVPSLLSSSSNGSSTNASQMQKQAEQQKSRAKKGILSPRILILQVTPDRTKDYNAFMNAAFAAMKANVPVDGCFLKKPDQKTPQQLQQLQLQQQQQAPSMTSSVPTDTSVFLEQTCDRTNGIFLNPNPNAQCSGGLLEILTTAFLPPLSTRLGLSLPKSKQVNFRARCFKTGQSVDQAHVCNLCLSIFKDRPAGECPTCGATVLVKGGNSRNTNVSINEDSKKKRRVK